MPTLNIKDPEVYELASELARRRATSMTGAVRQALIEALARTRLTPEEKIRRMTEIAKRSQAIDEPFLTDDDLYDEWGLPPLIVDSSALVAILNGEPEEDEFKAVIARHATRVSAATALEVAIVIRERRHQLLDALLRDTEISVVPFDAAQARTAREAYARFGKKSGSPARLNFGDCMAYALAKVSGEPLLFKGDDFTHTDVTPAR